MRIALHAEQRVNQMAVIMREKIHARILASQPAGEHENGQRKAVHFDEVGDDKGRERVEAAPVGLALWLEKAKRKADEND